MSGTPPPPHQNNIISPLLHTTEIIPSTTHTSLSTGISRTNLKRVNTPANLSLFNLMSGDANALAAAASNSQHKRSYSAVGRTAVPDTLINGAASAGLTMRPGTSASAMSALQMGIDSVRSPCFVHKTFGGSIDLERVLDECRAEEMTHHNLLQTATGVREVARQLGISQWYFTNFRSYRDKDEN